MKSLKLLPLVAALALTGCMSMAPSYERPEAPIAAAWPEGEAYAEAVSPESGNAGEESHSVRETPPEKISERKTAGRFNRFPDSRAQTFVLFGKGVQKVRGIFCITGNFFFSLVDCFQLLLCSQFYHRINRK